MDIRATGKNYKALKKMYDKYSVLDKSVVSITEDSNATVPVAMVKDNNNALVEWTRGFPNVASFIRYGYVRIIKDCPYQFGKCRGEKCQLYVVRNGTGDCAHTWSAIMGIEK